MDWGSFFLTLLIGFLFGYAMGASLTVGAICIVVATLLAWPLGWWVEFVDRRRRERATNT